MCPLSALSLSICVGRERDWRRGQYTGVAQVQIEVPLCGSRCVCLDRSVEGSLQGGGKVDLLFGLVLSGVMVENHAVFAPSPACWGVHTPESAGLFVCLSTPFNVLSSFSPW